MSASRARRARTAIGLAAAAGAVSLAAVGALAPAAAAAPRPAIEILSPARGADQVGKRQPMRVRVRVARGVTNLKAVVSGRRERVVTRRLKRGRSGVWTGKLRIGRELDRGAGALIVSGRRGGSRVAKSAHYFVASRRAELLRARGLPKHGAGHPLTVRLKTRPRVDEVRVRVNGKSARDAFASTAGGDWRGVLGASQGLRFGRNTITITAYDRDGDFERVTRTVRVPRGRPLAGAGNDVIVRARDTVRLDGRSTLPRQDERLRFHWRVVRAPKGAKPRLDDPTSLRPRLTTDRSGVYRVRLTATPRAGAGARASAAVQSSDTMTVGAQPIAPPKGIPVQTVGANDDSQNIGPGIKLGTTWYPMDSDPSMAVQLMAFDGATLDKQVDNNYPGTDAGMQELQGEVSSLPDTWLVVIQSPSSRFLNLSASGTKALSQLFDDLGIATDDSTGRWLQPGVPTGGWSVIGSTDGRTGRALIGKQHSPDRPEGEMDGFLQNAAGASRQTIGSTYVFNWPSTFNQFDTRSGGDGTTYNEMTIAGQTYRSDTIAAGASAFHLVWLDAGTLALRGQATVSGDQGGQLANTLAGISGEPLADPAVLFMTTIGHPSIPRPSAPEATDSDWADAAAEVASFGGNQSAFLALDGSGNADYSLVGATAMGEHAPNAGDDVSRVLRPEVPAPQLVGVLERRPTGVWSAATGGAPLNAVDVAALVPDIKRVLAQPDQPFEPFDGTGEPEAERYISEFLGWNDFDQTYGIRAKYWDPGQDPLWSNLSARISEVPPCTTSPCSEGFAAVKAQLETEFNNVANVRTVLGSFDQGTYYQAIHDAYTIGDLSFQQVAYDILNKYPPPPGEEAKGASPFEIVEGLVDGAAETAPEEIIEQEIPFGEALGVIGAGIEIASAFADTEGGGSEYLGATEFDAKASAFASTLTSDFETGLHGLNRIADLLVSDAGRLEIAGNEVENDWSIKFDLSAVLGRNMAAYIWQSLLPTTFKAYQCVTPPVYYPAEDFRPAPWYTPSGLKTPSALQFTPFTTVTHHPAKRSGAWGPSGTDGSQVNSGFVTIGRFFRGTHDYLDQGSAADIFGALDPNDSSKLGQLPAYFLASAVEKDGPGFDVDPGSFDPGDASNNGYVRYSCGGNNWREDVNSRGQ